MIIKRGFIRHEITIKGRIKRGKKVNFVAKPNPQIKPDNRAACISLREVLAKNNIKKLKLKRLMMLINTGSAVTLAIIGIMV